MSGDLLLFTGIYFIKSLDVMLMVMFLFGLLTTNRVNIGFIYFAEFMTKDGVQLFSTMYNIFEAMIGLEIAIYFLAISNNWVYFTLIGYTL